MAPPTSEFDRQLRELEAEIKRLEVEYNLFFAGRLAKLPWDTRARVEGLVKRYDRMAIQNTAERFRFQGLQSRFSAFCELWERSLKSRELGRPGQRSRSTFEPPISGAPASPPPPRLGATLLRNPDAEVDKIRALHEQFNVARREQGEGDVPFERFQEVVRAQISKVGSAGTGVAFKVSVRDGRVAFTAKPKTGDDE